jgi:hypothetical protein
VSVGCEAVLFSFYAPEGGDYIFSFTIEEARVVAAGGEIDPAMEWWKTAPDLWLKP